MILSKEQPLLFLLTSTSDHVFDGRSVSPRQTFVPHISTTAGGLRLPNRVSTKHRADIHRHFAGSTESPVFRDPTVLDILSQDWIAKRFRWRNRGSGRWREWINLNGLSVEPYRLGLEQYSGGVSLFQRRRDFVITNCETEAYGARGL